jgi:RNA polymerase sigma-70 factor (ECF subfamily)
VTDSNVNQDDPSAPTSVSLLERARRQEPGAWERMVGLYAPLVYSWCRKAHLQPADAEDVGQEVFRAVFRKLGEFRHDAPGNTFRGWLWQIAHNKILDHHRKHPRPLAGPGGSEALQQLGQLAEEGAGLTSNPSGEVDLREEARILLRQALKQLEHRFAAQTWQAFWQVSVQGRSAAEVAQELGTSVNTVYLAKSRILRRLREEFAGLVTWEPESSPLASAGRQARRPPESRS